MDSRSHCFIWDVCASLLIPYPAVSPGWRRRFMELSELAEQRHCRPYFPVGCSHAGDLPDSGEWLCYAAQRFPSSGACTCAFTRSQPLDEQVSLSVIRSGASLSTRSSLSRLERSLAYSMRMAQHDMHGVDTRQPPLCAPLDACVASRSHDNCAAATVVDARYRVRFARIRASAGARTRHGA